MMTLIENILLAVQWVASLLTLLCSKRAYSSPTTPIAPPRPAPIEASVSIEVPAPVEAPSSIEAPATAAAAPVPSQRQEPQEAEVVVQPRELPSKAGRRSNTSTSLGGQRPQSAPQPDHCRNSIRISGSFSHVKAARRAFKKHGFLDKHQDAKFPLNGHWQTDHGMTVVIEGKMVRWSQKRASRLRFTGTQRHSCCLDIYGESTAGQLAPVQPGEAKVLNWANGDVWRSAEGCNVGRAVLLSQTMTKTQRDASQDDALSSRASVQMQLLSTSGLPLLPDCLQQITQFIGSTSYYVSTEFDSKESPPWISREAGFDFLAVLSREHPHVEFRHCWASQDVQGQRLFRQGEEVSGM